MKLPTLPLIREKTRIAWHRFPISMILSLMATVSALSLIEKRSDVNIKLLMVSSVGYLLMLAISVFTESFKLDKRMKYLVTASGVLFLILYFFLLGDPDDFRRIDHIQYFLLYLMVVPALMIAPYIKQKPINAFWQYNKKVFLRLFFTFISSLTLYVGIALSIASFNYLLGTDIEEEWYIRTLFMVIGIIATHIFAAGIPENYKKLEKVKDYPKVIKIFSQYVLSPLLVLYGLILYLYGGKILATLNWPKGNVSYLVLIFSIIGVITMLLLYPARKNKTWVNQFSNIFYIQLIPLIFLLFGAVWIRVSDYGLTEFRCYVIILGLWLLGLSIYFSISKKYNIKVILYSLILIILVSSFGPLSIFEISSNNQVSRLEKVLKDNEILIDGKIQEANNAELLPGDLVGISTIIDYLGDTDSLDKIRDWFNKKDFDSIVNKNYGDESLRLMNLMGLEYKGRWAYGNVVRVTSSYYIRSKDRKEIDITNFKLLRNFRLDEYKKKESLRFMDTVVSFFISEDKKGLVINTAEGEEKVINMKDFFEEIINDYGPEEAYFDIEVPSERMIFEFSCECKNGNQVTVKFFLENATIVEKEDEFEIQMMEGFLLLG